mgnify:CR=1 FL=1
MRPARLVRPRRLGRDRRDVQRREQHLAAEVVPARSATVSDSKGQEANSAFREEALVANLTSGREAALLREREEAAAALAS